jgi:hypothetical protein
MRNSGKSVALHRPIRTCMLVSFVLISCSSGELNSSPSTPLDVIKEAPDELITSVTDTSIVEVEPVRISITESSIEPIQRNKSVCRKISIDAEDFRTRSPDVAGAIDRFVAYSESVQGPVAAGSIEVVNSLRRIEPYWNSNEPLPSDVEQGLLISVENLMLTCEQFLEISDYELEWASRSFDYGDKYQAVSPRNSQLAQFDPTQYAEVAPCNQGGVCKTGDIGPGGGVVIVALNQPVFSGAYLEVAPVGWARQIEGLGSSSLGRLGSPTIIEVRGTCDGLRASEEVPTFFCQEGAVVVEIQSLLVGLGYSIEIDGQYGPATASAVAGFQSDMQISVTGLVDQVTFSHLREFSGKVISVDSDPEGNLAAGERDCSGIDSAASGESGMAWPSGDITAPVGWGILNSIIITERCGSPDSGQSALEVVMNSRISGLDGWHLPSLFELELWCAVVTSASMVSLDGETTQFDGCQGFHYYSDEDSTLSESQKQQLTSYGVHFSYRYPNNPAEYHQFTSPYLSTTLEIFSSSSSSGYSFPAVPKILDFVTGRYSTGDKMMELGLIRPFRWFFPSVRGGVDLESIPVKYPNHIFG